MVKRSLQKDSITSVIRNTENTMSNTNKTIQKQPLVTNLMDMSSKDQEILIKFNPWRLGPR